MKRLKSSLITAALLVGMTAAASTFLVPAGQAVAAATHTIQVAGKGEMMIQPDVAYLNVGVRAEGATSQAAQAEAAKVMAKIQSALQANGIAKEDIQTIQFTSFPRYEWEKDRRVFKGFEVTHILRVTSRDLAKVGEVLDAVTVAGANQIDNIQFATEKAAEYEGAVLQKAMDHALKKASVLASASGKKIKDVVSIAEMGSQPPSFYQPLMMGAEAKAASPISTELSQGLLKVQAEVQVVYEME